MLSGIRRPRRSGRDREAQIRAVVEANASTRAEADESLARVREMTITSRRGDSGFRDGSITVKKLTNWRFMEIVGCIVFLAFVYFAVTHVIDMKAAVDDIRDSLREREASESDAVKTPDATPETEAE